MYMVCGYIVEKGCCLHVYGWWGMWSDSEDSPFCLNLQLLQQSRRWRGCQGRVGGWVVWCGVVVCGVMCVVWCGPVFREREADVLYVNDCHFFQRVCVCVCVCVEAQCFTAGCR